MKTQNLIGLDAAGAAQVVESLSRLLADYQVFYTNLRGFHWLIEGPDFFVLHAKFEELYDNVAEKVDEIAERMLTLGGKPENRFSHYLQHATVKEVSGVSNGREALRNILETYSYLLGQERQVLAQASEQGDEGTVALMSDYIREQEKLVWMLTAYAAK